tara:strand:- start:350 stop:1120 length:771 start_codon:yes stop_codon:yes gene_type:complete
MTTTIATWNVNSVRSRLCHITSWLEVNEVDILCLQETKVQDSEFPKETFLKVGFKTEFLGQKSYNGVCILFNKKAELYCRNVPGLEDEQKRLIAITQNNSLFINIYVPNGSSLGSEKFEYKIRWLDAFTEWISGRCKEFDNIFVLGDFNIAPCDLDVHDPEEWRNKILCSADERAYIEKLKSFGFIDLFRSANQNLKEFSWWDYRAASFRRNRGLRIDLILALTAKKIVHKCWIDSTPRGWEKPSDHTPVLARVDL